MIANQARQYYFDVSKTKSSSFVTLEPAVEKRFQIIKRTKALLHEWVSISMTAIVASNIDKFRSSCLELHYENLLYIQTSISSEFKSETIFCIKLLDAIKDVDLCQLTYQKPTETVQNVISDLHLSSATDRRNHLESGDHTDPSTHFVNRRYVCKNPDRSNNSSTANKCFVCKRLGCWYSNHSLSSRL